MITEPRRDNARGQAGEVGKTKRGRLDHAGNSSAAQRAQIMAALRKGALTTLQARRDLDILNPSQRVTELRQAGEKIRTLWTKESTECGRLARVARYVLDVPGVGTTNTAPASLVVPEAPPLAPATARLCRNGVWDLAVVACPFCGREHHHGGGSDEIPTFGSRTAHCHAAGTSRTYQVAPASRVVP